MNFQKPFFFLLATLAFPVNSETSLLPPTAAKVHHFCITRGNVAWSYNNTSSLTPLEISPYVDFSGYSIEITDPPALTIFIRITSGGTPNSIKPFIINYSTAPAPNPYRSINVSFRTTETQISHFAQALNSIDAKNTHFAVSFTLIDDKKPLTEDNIKNFNLERQTDPTACHANPTVAK